MEVASTGDISTYCRYDRLGRLIKTIDNSGNQFQAEYDSLDRKIRSVDPDMGTWTYAYDDAGRMVEQEDARNNRIQFSYDDEIGRVSQKRTYDHLGQLAETITYTYDASDDPDYTVHKGQVYKVTDSQGWTKTGYDSQGRAIKASQHVNATDHTYTTQTAYDLADRVMQVTYPDTRAVIAYSYDEANHLTKVESLWGTGADEVFYEACGFNEDHRPALMTYGNGRGTEYEYYPQSRRLQWLSSDNDPFLQEIRYTYDKVSNIKSVTDYEHTGPRSCSLSNVQYDDLHRLTSLYSTAEGRTISYEYTAIGNITRNGEMGAGAYTYHATQVHAVTAANGNTYAYDACGNMTTRSRSGKPNQTLIYDEQNRLTQVAIAGGNTIQFGYSAGGSRLWKKVNGQVTGLWIGSLYEEKDGKILCHVYAGDRLVATFEPESYVACLIQHHPYLAAIWNIGDGVTTALFGGGRAPMTIMCMAGLTGIALGLRYNRRRLFNRHGLQTYYGRRFIGGTDPWRQMVLLCMAASVFLSSNPQAAYAGTPDYDPVFYYYHPDHLGSSQLMTDRDGDVVQQYGYTPFGRENYKNNTYAFGVSNRYTGQTLDEDTGLYYYGARYYDPELARFIQADTVVPDPGSSQAYNRYAYCLGNPLKLTDPTGHYSDWSGMAYGAYMGAVNAGFAGGDMLTGAFIGAVNGAAGYDVIPTTNSSTLLTSMMTGNTYSTFDWSVFDPKPLASDYLFPKKDTESSKSNDSSPKSALPVRYDYASGDDTLARIERMRASDAVHATLDIAGSFDPTPLRDTLNAGIYAGEGRWRDAGLSMLGTVSYFGDMAKGGRLAAKTTGFMGFAAETGRRGLNPYEIGTWRQLDRWSLRGDDLVLHHVGQAHVMEQIVPGYTRTGGAVIVLPTIEHRRIPTIRGPYEGSARSLLANDIRNLRQYTEAPNSSLRELIELNKQMHPGAFKK